jgi:hypothetical protein
MEDVMKFSALFLLLFLSLSSFFSANAQMQALSYLSKAPAACTELYKAFGPWRFHRYETQSEPKDCFMSALSVEVPGLVYRSFLFTGHGELMIFNSYDGDVDSTASTGARVFYFFPRNQTPDIEDIGNVVFMKAAFAGLSLSIDYKTNAVLGFNGVEASIDPKVTPENQGGVEIKKSPTLWLDVGFSQGHDPTAEHNRIAVFHDLNGKTCKVKNSEIFTYLADGDNTFKYSDDGLKQFLKSRCPSLTVNY